MRVLSKFLRSRELIRIFSSPTFRTYSGYLRESYHCNEAWARRLQSPILQRVNSDDLFFQLDQKYQTDKVLSAIDVDIYINKVTDTETLDEMEELAYRLRKSPATADSLPSTSHALIRAFLDGQKTDNLMRILNDRMNYGIFVDFHLANILMDQFIKAGNHRDAAKIAGFLMLEEDFGPPTTKFFSLVSCLKYFKEPTPEPWEPPEPEVESEEETKIRLRHLRNVYFDEHFDLYEARHIVGKTLAKLGEVISEDGTVSRSVQILGWAMYGRWEKVENLLKAYTASKQAIHGESLNTLNELVDKAIAEIDASPTKTLAKPKLRQFPGMNLEEKDVQAFWDRIKYPEFSKIVLSIKSMLTSGKVSIASDKETLLEKSEKLLSAALSDHEDSEIKEQEKRYEEWEQNRQTELENQIRRFKAFQVTEEIAAKKKELKEKEEVIFFFDNEEEWMMKFPKEEQGGYKLPTQYIPSTATKFVKVIPPKKIRKKKAKV